MNHAIHVSIFTVAAACLAATPASAQTRETTSWFEKQIAAPAMAAELAVGTGYTQPFGKLEKNVGMPAVATPGVGLELDAALRLDPRWSLGVFVQYQELTAERAAKARGMSFGAIAAHHFDPDGRLDPWLELGTGYRLLRESTPASSPEVVVTHGFEIARVRLGLDLRVAPEVAFGPFAGADMNLLLWQNATTTGAIRDPSMNTFVFAGIQGRLDIPIPVEPRTRRRAGN